jgi:hypothetical protein
MSKKKKLPKLTDKQTKELLEGARMAHGNDGLDRFLEEVLNPKQRLPKISAKDMERRPAKARSHKRPPQKVDPKVHDKSLE